jgi:SAM-dependent methyltransferase
MSTFSYFEPLKRSYRNWLRKRNRVLPAELPPPFFFAKDISAVHEYFSAHASELGRTPDSSCDLNGSCHVCNKEVVFKVDSPADGDAVNWRETLKCPECGLINRWRSCLHVFESLCEPTQKDRIYLTETLSPVYQNLAGRFPLLVSSEYFPDSEFGEMVPTHVMPVRNEDVTQLSFDDSSLDIILCFDVLEHVPEYRSALKEFYRVLGKGGQLILSVPFSHDQKTLVRARLDAAGNIEHLVEPCYHGDPLSAQGVLSYYDFGMDLLDDMRAAGFQENFLVCYYSSQWAYLNGNVVFVARKL